MNIRKMEIADYNKVYHLWMSCKGMGLNDVDDSEKGIEVFLNRNPQTCFVAEENSEIIGAILAGNDGRRGYIYHTAVSYAHRNKGIATKMLDKVCEALSTLGISKAALVVFDRNIDGNAFWEKQGFLCREDLIYRNKALSYIIRIDT